MAGPITTSWRPGNTAPFEEMLQWWQAVGNTAPFEDMLQWWQAVANILFDLTDRRWSRGHNIQGQGPRTLFEDTLS